jgi:hypothetical protein
MGEGGLQNCLGLMMETIVYVYHGSPLGRVTPGAGRRFAVVRWKLVAAGVYDGWRFE